MGTWKNIVLCGFMGTGKTCVGKPLAQRLGLTFLDMDDVIEERQHRPISRIFEEDGEARFRELERELVRELSAAAGLVVATGGGIVLNPDNLRDFGTTGLVVCLSAEPDALLARIASDTSRPLLAGGEKMVKIRDLLASRQSLYAAIAHQVDTTHLTQAEVVERIAVLFGVG